jgi:Rrf2 family transcriptional regulator, iron-sulfur cluster assembly transcription factor
MSLLPRKGLFAIAAVIDVALQKEGQPVSAKVLAARHGLPPRHLEPVLQSLVRDGILNGIRGPRGGYELARARQEVTIEHILQSARAADEERDESTSELLTKVVLPALSGPEREFVRALSGLNLDDMARAAESLERGKGSGATRQ